MKCRNLVGSFENCFKKSHLDLVAAAVGIVRAATTGGLVSTDEYLGACHSQGRNLGASLGGSADINDLEPGLGRLEFGAAAVGVIGAARARGIV